MCFSDGQSKSNKEPFVNICSNKQSSATCTRNTGDKNCQTDKSPHMWPAKLAMNSFHMQPNKPIVSIHDKMPMQQIVPQEDDKNCQSTKFYKKKDQMEFTQVSMFEDKICQSNVCSDKNCQDTKFMWPEKPAMDMQSVTNPSYKR